MSGFTYIDGALHAESVSLADIADAVGTPFYCYSTAVLTERFAMMKNALAGVDATICFAIKANQNLAVIRILADLGAGADVVSGGELLRALAGGVPASRIVFSGVGKTEAELRLALEKGIRQINVESRPEFETLSRLAASMGKVAPIAFRVNPDVDAATHAKITTGKKENKFGIGIAEAMELYREAATTPGVDVAGVAVHIGSQLTDLEPFRAAFAKLRALYLDLKQSGLALRRIDIGGGLGVPYRKGEEIPDVADYGRMAKEAFGDLGVELEVEPGRFLVAEAGALVSRVTYVKQGEERQFVILDAAMNDLVRPAMYEAHHEIAPVIEPAAAAKEEIVDVVGPICESSDTFATQRSLPPFKAGDLAAILCAGAYGASMSSTYNGRPLAPEILVRGDRFAVVRARQSFEEMIRGETTPNWA